MKLRDLGGLVRSAGDVAIEKGADLVTAEHVLEAKRYARTLEQQIADKSIMQRKDFLRFAVSVPVLQKPLKHSQENYFINYRPLTSLSL